MSAGFDGTEAPAPLPDPSGRDGWRDAPDLAPLTLPPLPNARLMREAPRLTVPDGLYDEFAARFPYDETEDQQNAIDSVLDDMGSGRPMDLAQESAFGACRSTGWAAANQARGGTRSGRADASLRRTRSP